MLLYLHYSTLYYIILHRITCYYSIYIYNVLYILYNIIYILIYIYIYIYIILYYIILYYIITICARENTPEDITQRRSDVVRIGFKTDFKTIRNRFLITLYSQKFAFPVSV